MGKRGPKPLPTAILEARGSREVASRAGEPKPPLGAPETPNFLEGDSLATWNQLVPQVLAMGVLTTIDWAALARYCCLWVQWVRCIKFVEANGMTYEVNNGQCQAMYPEVGQITKLSTVLSKLEADFGLTPSARARLSVPVAPAPNQESEKSQFSFGGREVAGRIG